VTVPVYHITGCGGVAFLFVHEPYEGMPLDPESVVYPDGEVPPKDTRAHCWSCQDALCVADLTIRPPLA
jgi:hypothetical protein